MERRGEGERDAERERADASRVGDRVVGRSRLDDMIDGGLRDVPVTAARRSECASEGTRMDPVSRR